jgi:hypothetical protein
MIDRIPERLHNRYGDPLSATETKLNEVIKQVNVLTVLTDNLNRENAVLRSHVHEGGSKPKQRTPGNRNKLRPIL